MSTLRRVALSLSAVAVGSVSNAVRLDAQVTEVSRTPIADAAQLTFGYLCDDRFLIRNDGTQSVELEYTKLALNARETVELESKSRAAMELWKDGKLVAKADKQKRSCKDVLGNASVSVAPLEVSSNTQASRNPYNWGYGYGMGYGFGAYPFYDPWMYGMYGGLGFRRGFVQPIVFVSRGGGRRGR
jgi:hypothetical protein